MTTDKIHLKSDISATFGMTMINTTPLPGTDLGIAGPLAILVFGAPGRCDLFSRLSEKR